jgi:small subunit ribosomal protein S17
MADTQDPENGAEEQAQSEPEAPEQAPAGDDAQTQAEAPSAEAEAGAQALEESPEAPVAPEPSSPKERRRLARSRHTEARAQRSPEERHSERLAERGTKAARRRSRRVKERAKAAERREASRAGEAAAGAEASLAPVHGASEGKRKVRQGIVISDKAQKTIVVRIDVARRHRRYEKIVRSSSTLHAHDENNDAREGDVVRVIESRPLSRTKRWRLVEVLERAR